MTRTLVSVAALALLATGFAAIADDHAHHDHANAGSRSEATAAFAAANDKMHKDMAIAFTGDADVDFATGMIPHHEGAVAMAQVQLKYGKDPELRKLAEDIVKAQDTEIAFMKAWLAKHTK